MVGDRDKLLAAGFDGYLAKPIDPTAFVAQLEVYLAEPLRALPTMRDTRTTLSPEKLLPGQYSMLVVDNLRANLDLASSVLEYAGYAVMTAQDINMALALALAAPPDLIMSDVCMPSGSGFDFIATVKADARLRDIPFVFVTSTAVSERERVKGLALGAAKYLFRPLEPQALLAEIESCLKGGKET
jgi:two-component system cell cycle response regulator